MKRRDYQVPDMIVWNKTEERSGRTTGRTRKCGTENCGGIQMETRWKDDVVRWCCSNLLERKTSGDWRMIN